MDSLDRALDYCVKAYSIRKALQFKRGWAMAASKIGRIALTMGNSEKAMFYALEGFRIADRWSYSYEKKESERKSV